MFCNYNNLTSHIHLKIFNNEFILKNKEFDSISKLFGIYYTIKKNSKYDEFDKNNKKYINIVPIDYAKPTHEIINELVNNYYNLNIF